MFLTKKKFLIPFLVLWIVLVAVSGPFAGRLADVQTNDNLQFLPQSSESSRVAEITSLQPHKNEVPALIVVESNSAIDVEAVKAAVGNATATKSAGENVSKEKFLEEIPAQVAGLFEYAAGVKSAVEDVPEVSSVTDPIPSEDGQAVLLVASVSTEDTEMTVSAVENIQVAVDGLASADYTVAVGGPAVFLADLTEAFEGIDGMLLVVALLVVGAILLFVYRSPILPVVVLFVSMAALSFASAVVYFLAKYDVIMLNGQAQGILFILVVGATTDYALLLVSRLRENLTVDSSGVGATFSAVKQTFEPIVASAGTVIGGVLVLGLSDLKASSALGPVAAVGVACSAITVLCLLSTVLALGGRRLFWPKMPSAVAVGEVSVVEGRKKGLWEKLSQNVRKHPRRSWVFPTVVLLLLIPVGFTFPAVGIPTSAFFTTETSSQKAASIISDHYPAGLGQETVVAAPAGLEDSTKLLLESAAAGGEGVATVKPGGVVPPVGQPEWFLYNVTLEDAADSDGAEKVVKQLRGELPDGVLVGGSTATQIDTNATSLRDSMLIMPLILLVILCILIILLRSVVIPVVLVGSVVLSFGATYGLGAIVFQLLGQPGSDPSVPLFAFVFLAALGVDYNIFLMTRAREETKKSTPREGIVTALAVTGAVITSAGLVLASTFAALAVLPLLFLFQIAFLVSVGVLLDTFVVRTLIVPGLVFELNYFGWWPGRLSRRPLAGAGEGENSGGNNCEKNADNDASSDAGFVS